MKSTLLILLTCFSTQAQIITEFFPDPSPSKGLPNYEFLEIYNPTEFPIRLKGYTLLYAGSKATFPDSTLLPKEYAVVCRYNRANDFIPYGKVIALSNFSLPNASSSLHLIDSFGQEIFSLFYDESWNIQGGISMEMKDTEFACLGRENWTPSIHPLGGTPGKPNSVLEPIRNIEPPRLISFDLLTDSLIVQFNRAMNARMLNYEHYLAENKEIKSISFFENNKSKILLTFNTPPHHLYIFSPTDCLGGVGEDLTLDFVETQTPEMGQILISELLFDPPKDSFDYIEIQTSVPINLKNWKLRRIFGQRSEEISLATQYLVSQPYQVFTTDTLSLKLQFPMATNMIQVPKLPTLPQDSATLLLLDPKGKVYDRIHYHTKMHAALLDSPKGKALERMNNTWKTASMDSGYGTPGYENSQNVTESGNSFRTEPEVFSDEVSLHYILQNSELYARIMIIDRDGQVIFKYPTPYYLGTNGKITWNGCDSRGQSLPNGLYIFRIQVYGKDLQQNYYVKCVLKRL